MSDSDDARLEELQSQNAELLANREALDVERRRYRDLFETIPDGYLITDAAGVIREANAVACRLFGRPRAAVLGKPLARFIEGTDRRSFYAQLSRIGRAEIGGHLSVNLAFHDHATVPVNLRATHAGSLADDASEIKWLIRDRRHDVVTEALRRSEERLRALFETAQVGIMLCDLDGEILFVNEYADAVLDREPGATQVSSWIATTHPDDLAALQHVLRDVAEDGTASSIRYRLIHRSSEQRWVDHSVAPFRDPDGQPVGTVSTLTDVTAEQGALAELSESQKFTAALLDTIGTLVVVVDPDGRILRFNKTCEALSGFSAREVVGRSLVEMLIPADQRDAVAAVIADLRSPGGNTFENDWITHDGRRRTIAWTNTNLTGPDGTVTAIIGTGIDVTDARLIESRLAQSDRLSAIGRLTSGIAHDFNNTLTTLRLRIDRLSSRHVDDDSRADLSAATSTIDRTQALIADLLSFSSQQRMAVALVDVNVEIRRLIGMLPDLLGDDISITVTLTDDDTTVLIDPARFEQVMLNLAVNARDAMSRTGKLLVQTRTHSVPVDSEAVLRVSGQLAPGSYVVVSVTDSGVGIEPKNLPHVFDPYFTTKPRGRGTGLGLATTYGTVRQSGGAIVVDSEPGRGSTFEVWLPRAGSTPRPAPAVSRSQGRRPDAILVVDDDEDIRRAIADELRRLGCHVVQAASSAEALDLVGHDIDVLITDVQLPDLDGIELARRFTERHASLSVVYMSGATDAELKATVPDEAVLIRKPFTTAMLVAALPGTSDGDSSA